GSVKSNLGHLDAAAGLAGLVKTALVLERRMIPPTINYAAPNPAIDFDASPFQVADRLMPLPDHVRRAAVSSFGIGGTNVHAILEQALSPAVRTDAPGPYLVPLSARSPDQLARYAAALADHLDTTTEHPADVAFTLQMGRTEHRHRVAFVVSRLSELLEALRGVTVESAVTAPAAGSGDIDRWVADRDLDALARHWAGGGDLPWERIRGGVSARRVSLPPHPFATQHHWLAPAMPTAPFTFAEERWVPSPATASRPTMGSVVCVLPDVAGRDGYRRGIGEDVRVTFVDDVAQVSSAGPADAVHFVLPDDPPEQVLLTATALLRAVAAMAAPPSEVVLAVRGGTAIQQAAGDALVACEPSVRPILPATAVRVVLHDTGLAAEEWARLLRAEHDRGGSVRYLGGTRYVRSITEVDVQGREPAFRDGATYLVTGGSAGLGAQVAEHLARHHQANLVLVGRSEPDEGHLARLRAHRTEVRYVRLDVADEVALTDAVRRLPDRLRPVGAVHAAGVAHPSALTDRDAASTREVLAGKVCGTLALERALEPFEPEFLVCFSSASATFGDFGAVDYAMANRFQSAYARALRDGSATSRVLAVEWPLWAEGGMGALAQQSGDPTSGRPDSGAPPLPTAVGLDLLGRLISSGRAVTVVRPPSRVPGSTPEVSSAPASAGPVADPPR
ncbi:MAG: SDR family NAD(P)-dependent oxidoreductase, partial [Phycicoccus sp.]